MLELPSQPLVLLPRPPLTTLRAPEELVLPVAWAASVVCPEWEAWVASEACLEWVEWAEWVECLAWAVWAAWACPRRK